jgi:hypothetical protein
LDSRCAARLAGRVGAAGFEPPRENGSISAADFAAFDPLSADEAGFRENVWQFGAQNRMPKNG